MSQIDLVSIDVIVDVSTLSLHAFRSYGLRLRVLQLYMGNSTLANLRFTSIVRIGT